MPGYRLSDNERNYGMWWNNCESFPHPVLKGISISGAPGLRGITNIDINFDYPLTAICGKNGSGKTTLLALSALAFHSIEGHHSYQARNYNLKNSKSYYTFVDFFFKGKDDPDITGVKISWKYEGNLPANRKERTIEKKSKQWMKYHTRPKRSVHYFGASRILPAIEKNVLRGHFRVNSSRHRNIHLNEEYRRVFCEILGRQYDDAAIATSEKYSLRTCTYGSSYTSFNMGAGEDTLIELLYHLQEAQNGSLIVIEEVELGLHPEAQAKFAKKLIEIGLKKKFQIIVSTHSSTFIDNIPRVSRILIQRTGSTTHEVIKAPTTRYAMGDLHGSTHSELTIYCEDKYENSFAERIIRKVMSPEIRKRASVIAVGSNEDVARQCGTHTKASWPGKYLGVFDGDVTTVGMKKFMKKCLPEGTPESKYNCYLLPEEGLNPEKWVLKEILSDDARLESLKDELGEGSIDTVRGYLNSLDLLGDPHDIGHEFSKFTGLRQIEAEDYLIKAACTKNPVFNYLLCDVFNVLDGEKWFVKKILSNTDCFEKLKDELNVDNIETVKQVIERLDRLSDQTKIDETIATFTKLDSIDGKNYLMEVACKLC